jgi:hypothetical protein
MTLPDFAYPDQHCYGIPNYAERLAARILRDQEHGTFTDLTSFQLEEWLWEGNPTAKERRAILQELETRDKRRQAIGDLFW